MSKRKQPIDLDKLATMMLDDLNQFKDNPHDVAVMYLHRAFKLGDENGWWIEVDKSKGELDE